jgi:hypothetical protein
VQEQYDVLFHSNAAPSRRASVVPTVPSVAFAAASCGKAPSPVAEQVDETVPDWLQELFESHDGVVDNAAPLPSPAALSAPKRRRTESSAAAVAADVDDPFGCDETSDEWLPRSPRR